MDRDLRRQTGNSIISPRHLALRHAKKQRLRALDDTVNTFDEKPKPIAPGQEQLYSFYVPGLQTGKHTITVEQDIKTRQGTNREENNTLPGQHEFNVIGPRFSLPEGALHSFYPPQAHADRDEVLPNVVFTDPTFPWERGASQSRSADYSRNRVPWLAVFVFTQEELRLSPPDLASVFENPDLQKQGLKQSSNLSTAMFTKDTQKLSQTNTSPIIYEKSDGDAKTDVIFLRKELFASLFAQYDSNGQKVSNANCYVQHHRYLAHLRHIHLDGTASAAKTDNDDHVYSVVVSHRIGALEITKPTPVVAHLVNIEGVERMDSSITQTFVSMSSLLSWEYTCLPPESLNVKDEFAHLGRSINVLKPIPIDHPKSASAGNKSDNNNDDDDNSSKIRDRLDFRINDGFSLLRYRIQTGEVTAAFSKGPLTPTAVRFKDPLWPPGATTGTKLQILDPNLNIMDITYSAAWNLGKALGLAHPEFATALGRVRKQIFDMGLNDAQRKVIQRYSEEQGIPAMFKDREQVLGTIKETIQKLNGLPFDTTLRNKPDGMVRRWHRPRLAPLDLSYSSPEIRAIINQSFREAAKKISSSIEDPKIPYNELNTPYSTDWAVVLRWIMERYFLVDVPPHYLITDPSHLPFESVRVFAIDHAWVCAMVDGGLSLANHLDQDDDLVRNAMKWAFNNYLDTPYPEAKYKPLTPRYGFYVRSALITKFPDLIVGIETRTKDGKTTVPLKEEEAPVLLQHDIVDKNLMFCLMREPPKDDGSMSLFLREPPHQKYFAAAAEINTKKIDMKYKRVYTKQGVRDPLQKTPIDYTYCRGQGGPEPAIFIWGDKDDVRVLNIEAVAHQHVQKLNEAFADHQDWYNDSTPNSALMGIQLSEPQWQIEIELPTKQSFPDLSRDNARHLPVPPDSKVDLPSIGKISNEVQCSPYPTFGDRKRPSPIVSTYHPPHVRLPQLVSNVDLPSENIMTASNPSQFEYKLYPVSKIGKEDKTIPMLPDRNGRPSRQDLVFSIVFVGTPFDFRLKKLVVHIGLGSNNRQLMQNYTGAGPSMLSNLRLNVIQQLDTKNQALVLTLKPRSRTGLVPIKGLEEISFLLSGVVVNQYDENTPVEIQAVESYEGQSDNRVTIYGILAKVS